MPGLLDKDFEDHGDENMHQRMTMATVIIPMIEHRRDVELPSNVPIKQLSKLILKGLSKESDLILSDWGEASIEISQPGQEWRLLDGESTLENASVLDGAYLRVNPKA